MNHTLDIVCTATKRPGILKKTLDSFKRKLFMGEQRLIINIDPIGIDKASRLKMVEMCCSYFKDVTYNLPDTPSFPKAFKWTWDQVKAPYTFLLEDDWELMVDININEMMLMLEDHPELALLRLPMFRSTTDNMKNWNKFFPWNGEYFACPHELRAEVGFCGHPSLIKSEFVKNTRDHIDVSINPEKQFHNVNSKIREEVLKWEYGVFGLPNQPAAIRDIGRRWMIKNNFRKKGNKAWFMEWNRCDS